MSTGSKCYLKNVEDGTEVILADNEEVILGRNTLTGIKNPLVSKAQVSCLADLSKFQVKVKWLGNNMSGINGYALKRNVVYHLTHNDRIETLIRKMVYEIVFDPVPPYFLTINGCEESQTKTPIESVLKRKRENEEMNTLTHFKKDKGMTFEWERLYNGQLHFMKSNDSQASNKIAGYDVDGTIIKTQSGRVFPKDMNDWAILYPEIPQKLKSLRANGYKIVFFTNQAGIGSGKVLLKDFKTKLERIACKLNVPIEAYISTTKNIFRKPAPGMWDEMIKRNGGLPVDIDQSFYCGDAAGRPANWAPKMKKDHSLADRLFALNIGLPFYTPEEHFLKMKSAEYTKPTFDPRSINTDSLTIPNNENMISKSQEIVLLVGYPASGKSFVCTKFMIPAGYKWINRDTLGTASQCLKAVESAILDKRSVVVDNTNIDVKSRQPFVQLAKQYNLPIRCAIMNVTIEHCRHNSFFRELTDSSHAVITSQIIYTFRDKYQEPKIEEGFDKLFKINFVPHFTDQSLESLYKKFLLEK